MSIRMMTYRYMDNEFGNSHGNSERGFLAVFALNGFAVL